MSHFYRQTEKQPVSRERKKPELRVMTTGKKKKKEKKRKGKN